MYNIYTYVDTVQYTYSLTKTNIALLIHNYIINKYIILLQMIIEC